MEDGTVPVSALLCRYKPLSFVRYPNEVGIVPESRLEEMSISVRELMSPKAVGIVPLSLLPIAM